MKNISNIIRIARPLYYLIGIIGGLIVVNALIDLVLPLFSKYIVDEIQQNIQHRGGSLNHLWFLIGAAFALGILANLLTAITERIGDHFAGRLRKFLTERFYEKVLTLPQSYFDSEISGKIVNQLNRGIQTIQVFVNTSTNFIIPMFLQSILTIGLMAYFNIPAAVFTFLLFPIYLGLSYYSTKKWGEEEVKKNKIEDYSRGRIQEVITNVKLVKSFNNEQKEFEIIASNLDKSNAIYAKQSKTFHIFDFLRNGSLTIILTIVSVIIYLNTYDGKITIGTMVLLLQLMNQARRPLFGMSFILTQIQSAEAGSKEFFEILNLPSKEVFSTPFEDKKIENPTIRFDKVSFKYSNSDYVFKNISFTLDPHEKVALVGHSGVGKTTVVNLILKLYEATEGNIFLSDKNYKDLDHRFIRNNISLVFQDNELFSTTIRENVAYGQHATDKEIHRALELANAADFVKKLPKGIESEVGERGVRLSGGQKQRIQIARAILKNAPILILDEATSSLDSQSENEVQKGLENLMKDKLVIIIAHRFSTIQNVHKIIVLDKGGIVDCGTPQELARREGLYSALLNYQIEGNKKLLEQFEIY